MKNTVCHLCKKEDSSLLMVVDKRPDCEINYNIPEDKYYRELRECQFCGVIYNAHDTLIHSDFYTGFYNNAITSDKLQKRFDKIISLPFSNSDNKNRVLRIINFLYSVDKNIHTLNVLDVGTGTGVFLNEMVKFGLSISCVDPDPHAIEHVSKNIQLKNTWTGKFSELKIDESFDLISFNKVLEHVENPVAEINKAFTLLNEEGLIYIELPDATPTMSAKNFTERTEFNLEHYTVYNEKSLSYLVGESGGEIINIESIHDPSGKHTIYCFIQKA